MTKRKPTRFELCTVVDSIQRLDGLTLDVPVNIVINTTKVVAHIEEVLLPWCKEMSSEDGDRWAVARKRLNNYVRFLKSFDRLFESLDGKPVNVLLSFLDTLQIELEKLDGTTLTSNIKLYPEIELSTPVPSVGFRLTRKLYRHLAFNSIFNKLRKVVVFDNTNPYVTIVNGNVLYAVNSTFKNKVAYEYQKINVFPSSTSHSLWKFMERMYQETEDFEVAASEMADLLYAYDVDRFTFIPDEYGKSLKSGVSFKSGAVETFEYIFAHMEKKQR